MVYRSILYLLKGRWTISISISWFIIWGFMFARVWWTLDLHFCGLRVWPRDIASITERLCNYYLTIRTSVESTKSSFDEIPILNALLLTQKTTGESLEQWPEMTSLVPFSGVLGHALNKANFKNSLQKLCFNQIPKFLRHFSQLNKKM